MESTVWVILMFLVLCVVVVTAVFLVHRANRERDMARQGLADAKTEFLSKVSYDIKTPMNVIVGTAALGMEETDDPEKMKECLSRIRSASEFLMELLNDLLDMSKIEMGKFHLHPRPYAFSDFAEGVRLLMEPACRRKNIRFEMTEEEININMMVDPMRFQQIFFNLLANAVKFTPEGGIVTFRICNYATHNDVFSADYVVKDNGIGMSQEFQKILFEPFTQETGYRAEKRNGAGLGLAITRNIVDLMKGTISIKSELGEGTEVKVHLDVDIASIQPEKESEQLEMQDIRKMLRKKRVLLAEDHPMDVEITRRILENVNMDVVCVESGKEALELFSEKEEFYFDVVLMDICVPEMDNLDAARQMRQTHRMDSRTIPMIAMTANNTVEDIHICKEAGMNAHIAKPIEPQKLYQVLCEHLQETI